VERQKGFGAKDNILKGQKRKEGRVGALGGLDGIQEIYAEKRGRS